MPVCTKCGVTKPASGFQKRHGKPYLRRQCRQCYAATQKAWVKAHPEQMKQHQAKYRSTEKRHEIRRVKARKNGKELPDFYVKQRIAERTELTASDIPPDLVKLYRLHLIMKRQKWNRL